MYRLYLFMSLSGALRSLSTISRVTVWGNFIDVLKRIEDGEIDQHEGSYLVGQLLKKIYIDSAVRSAENADRRSGKKKSKEPSKLPAKKISWTEYKKMSADDASASTTQ